MSKITLRPNKDEVRVIGAPSEDALSTVASALEEASFKALIDAGVQQHLPMELETDRTVGEQGESAKLYFLPISITRAEDGKGWKVTGQATNQSDFVSGEEHTRAPRIQGYINPTRGNSNFAVV